MTACCSHAGCNHHQGFDLAKVRDQFGRDALAEIEYQAEAEMHKCGGMAVGLIYSPTTPPSAYPVREVSHI